MVDEKQVSEIVKNVIAGMDISSFDNKPARKQLGVFDTMEEAIAACNKAAIMIGQVHGIQIFMLTAQLPFGLAVMHV